MEKYNIVFSVDKLYVQHLAVAIISLLENNKKRYFKIFVISGEDVPLSDIEKLRVITSKFNAEIVIIRIGDVLFSEMVTNYHFTKAMYYRLLIPDLISDDKVLYLDCDIVVNESIHQLYNNNIDPYFVAAVLNPGFTRNRELNMSSNSDYFNSGVLLINLKKWRDENLKSRVILFLSENKKVLQFPDQDGLNAIIDGNWKLIPLKFNQQAVIFENNFTDRYPYFAPSELYEAKTSPVIIHYSGSSKPWHTRNKHPFKYLYWRYLRMTPYKYSLPTDLTLVNILKWITPRFLKNSIKKLSNTTKI